jgi:hypothetical protein
LALETSLTLDTNDGPPHHHAEASRSPALRTGKLAVGRLQADSGLVFYYTVFPVENPIFLRVG